MKKSIFLFSYFLPGILLLLLMNSTALSQENDSITGRVFPVGMRTPIRNVKVYLQGDTTTLAITNGDGFFRLHVNTFPVKLVFSKKGYAQQVLEVKRPQDIVVHLFAAKLTNDYGKAIGVRVTLNPESRDGILVLSSADKRFKYWFDNRIYLDGAAYFGDNKNIGNGVNVRRMRFAMKTILWGHWGGEIDFDFAYNEVDIKDAYVRYIGTKMWQVKAGNFKEPFSMETTTTSRYLTFMERPVISKLAPSRHLGVSYRKWGLRYYFEAGLFSSKIANDLMQSQNKKGGTNAGWSATGRFAFATIKRNNEVLHVGIAGSYRTPKIPEYGDPVNSFRFSNRAETSINRKKYVDTDWIEYSKHMTLLGLELAYAYKNFRVQGEYMRGKVSRDSTKVPAGEDKAVVKGLYGIFSWLINNADYYYNMEEAEFSQINFRNNHKGAFELAFRYSYADANTFKKGVDIPYIQGGACSVYSIGLNYYFNYNVKIMLNYNIVNNDRWADGKGKYDTYKTNPTGKGGIDFNILQARVEIDF
jgi:phosphate-selective porin OprO/OprP